MLVLYIYLNFLHRNKLGKLNEIASLNKMRATYEVISTNGPSHLMRFAVKCVVGDKETVGDGIGKKAAKLEAATKMIDLLMNTEEIKNRVNSSKSRSYLSPVFYHLVLKCQANFSFY